MNRMDKQSQKMLSLEKELASKDSDLIRAATIGKQLLEESVQLKSCIEGLKQEKHSLQLNLNMKIKIIENQASEIEFQRESFEALSKDLGKLNAQNAILDKKLQDSINEKDELKNALDEEIQKNQHNEVRIASLSKELDSCKITEVPHNEISSDDHMKVVSDLEQCEIEKSNLMILTAQLQEDLRNSNFKAGQLSDLIEGLQKELEDRDKELQSYSVIVEKAKEEKYELQAQIEMLKYEQVDVKRRGNSVFGEVEDQRKLVEKEYFKLRHKYNRVLENYKLQSQELQKTKHQLSAVLGMFSSKSDSKYLEEVETRLISAQKEVSYLTGCLNDQSNALRESSAADVVSACISTSDEYDYLRALLMQSRKKEEELDRELQRLRKLFVVESSQLTETQHSLYKSERTCENLQAELMKMKIKIEELKPLEPDAEAPAKQICEKIPGFVGCDSRCSEVENDSKLFSSLGEMENKDENYLPFLPLPGESSSSRWQNILRASAEKPSLSPDAMNKLREKKKSAKKATVSNLNVAVTASNCAQQ